MYISGLSCRVTMNKLFLYCNILYIPNKILVKTIKAILLFSLKFSGVVKMNYERFCCLLLWPLLE